MGRSSERPSSLIRTAEAHRNHTVVTPKHVPSLGLWLDYGSAFLPARHVSTINPMSLLTACGLSGASPHQSRVPFLCFLRLFLLHYSNRAIVSSYEVVENQRRQAAVPAELSRTIVLGRGGSVSFGGFCRQLKQMVLPIRSKNWFCSPGEKWT